MKTHRTRVEGTCYIWARPKTDWQIERDLDEVDGDTTKVDLFRFEITTSPSHWDDEAVNVAEFDVVGMVPEGVDLVKAAVETLRDEISRVRAEADKRVGELEQRIKNLALLEFQDG